MDWPAFATRLLLDDGRISEVEVPLIRRAVLSDGVDRREVEFLVRLKRQAVSVHPTFDALLCQVLRAVVLADGRVSDAEADWLRQILLADGTPSDPEREFVTRLRAEVPRAAGLDRLYADMMAIREEDVWG